MDLSLRKWSTFGLGQANVDFSLKKCCRDGFGSLPDELVSQILSSLPTKDAAVASVLSKKMRRASMHLTALDFDDLPVSYCAMIHPQPVDRFQFFKTFVDNVLQTSQSPHLSRFRLGFGGDFSIMWRHFHEPSFSICSVGCFPDLESTHLNAWICFPLSRCGVKEIDLRIYVRKPENLPSALFDCETLEVLKLDTNLDFELVSRMPSFRLPNLKVLQLHSTLLPEDDFVTRLVSNCPLLEELYIDCCWKHGNSVAISSPSLQKLVLHTDRPDKYSDFFSINTPNLQYLVYTDLLALHYPVASMKALVEASIDIWNNLGTYEAAFHSMLSLVRAVSNVQHLCLLGSCMEALDYDDLKNQLPVFHNLKHLELGHNTTSKWDTVLLEFLEHSPHLETLEFPIGLAPYTPPELVCEDYSDITELERQTFGTNKVSPCCCKYYLKRIVIKEYWGFEREVELVRFLLKNASVLEELLVICKDKVDQASLESALNKLPKASPACLIIVQISAL